jgi:hypothetical protein
LAGKLLDWLDEQKVETAVREQAESLWQAETKAEDGLDTLERVVATVALVEPRAGSLLEVCRSGVDPTTAAEARWYADESVSPLVRNHMRLLVGRGLVQGLYFDEGLNELSALSVDDVLDPASLLFYRGIAHHRLLRKDDGLEALDRLLENRDIIPRRYAVLARLMRSDLEQIKDGSLDDISRRMKDIERRLGLGRANKKVRDIEDEVVKMLDKLIEEEEKKQAAAAAAAAAGGSIQSSSPAPDSRPLGGKGKGEVTKRDIGDSAGWGELPAKQREETMQEIGRDFPAHYREVIEEYFRELAKQKR